MRAVHLHLGSSNAREHGEAIPIANVRATGSAGSASDGQAGNCGPDTHRQWPRRAFSRPQLLLRVGPLERLRPAKANCRSLSVTVGRCQ
eukprot:6667010-Prymnesium_polylepis.1